MLSVRFKCQKCSALIESTVDDPGYDTFADKESDAQGFADENVTCGECETEHVVEVLNYGAGISAALAGYPYVEVEVIDDPYSWVDVDEEFEQWLDDTPEFPERMFLASVREFQKIEDLAPSPWNGQQAFHRMIFSQYFAAFEAYLSTRLVKLVADYPAALKSLVIYHKEFSAKPMTYAEALDDIDVIRRTVVVELNNLVWHKLANVDHLYKGVFGKTIFPTKEVKEFLFKRVQTRHDCVHRNGRDKEGVKTKISTSDLRELRVAMSAVVDHIEAMYVEYNKQPERAAFNMQKIAKLLVSPPQPKSTETDLPQRGDGE